MRKPLVTSLADLKKKVQTKIVCTNDNIDKIVKQEIEQLGNNANLNHLDVSRVTNMRYLFYNSGFNGDISGWDVSKVNNMENMFAHSKFNGNILNWNVSKVEDMGGMFFYSEFDQDISKWDVSNAEGMDYMFAYSPFNHDVSSWQINPKCDCRDIFEGCPIIRKYKPKLPKKQKFK